MKCMTEAAMILRRECLNLAVIGSCILINSAFTAVESGITANRTCPGIRIRYSLSELNVLKGCTIILGNLLLFHLRERDDGVTWNDVSFPQLKEVTGYLLVYWVSDLKSLGPLFPNLAVIRGQQLINGYSLLIHRAFHLQEINLYNLGAILRGGVSIGNCPNLCYGTTIKWDLLVEEQVSARNIIDEYQHCRCNPTLNCPVAEVSFYGSSYNTTLCWSYDRCQQVCPAQCTSGCTSQGHCCSDKCLGGCQDDASTCKACRFYRGKECSKECSVMYNGLQCLETTCDQLRPPHFLVRRGKSRECLLECPSGFVPAGNNECSPVKETVVGNQVMASLSQLQQLKDVSIINGSLTIRLDLGSYSESLLANYLGSVREIFGYLGIFSTSFITSLNFLGNLTIIHGRSLYENRYALYIYGNDELKQVWSEEKTVSITKGNSMFLLNRKLCFREIQKYIKNGSKKDRDLIKITNGFSVPCDVEKIQIKLALGNEVDSIDIRFDSHEENYSFVMVYHKIAGTHPENTSSVGKWNVSIAEVKHEGLVTVEDLEAFTTYYIYIESLYFHPGGTVYRSDVANITTSVGHPEAPRNFSAIGIGDTWIQLAWQAPRRVNGPLKGYVIRAVPSAGHMMEAGRADFCDRTEWNSLVTMKNKRHWKLEVDEEAEQAEGLQGHEKTAREDVTMEHALYRMKERLEDTLFDIVHSGGSIRARRQAWSYVDMQNHLVNMSKAHFPELEEESWADVMNDMDSIMERTFLSELQLVYPFHGQLNGLEEDVIHSSAHYKRSKRSFGHVVDAPSFPDAVDVGAEEALVFNKTDLEPLTSYMFEVHAIQHSFYCSEVAGKFRAVYCNCSGLTRMRCKFPNENPSYLLASTTLNNFRYITDMEGHAYENNSIGVRWSLGNYAAGKVLAFHLTLNCLPSAKSLGRMEKVFHCLNVENSSRYSAVVALPSQALHCTAYLEALSASGYIGNSSVFVYFPSTKNEDFLYFALVGVLLILAVILAFLSYTFFRWKMVKFPGFYNSISTVNPMYKAAPEWVNCIYELLEPRHILEKKRLVVDASSVIGKGNFGVVRRGTLMVDDEEVVVAVKQQTGETPRSASSFHWTTPHQSIQDMIQEACLILKLQSFYIIKAHGVVVDVPTLYLVMEFMENGDLCSFLRSLFTTSIFSVYKNPEVAAMCLQIADGMAYLAAKGILHMDLAARNCLIDKALNVKISDFGLSRTLNQEYKYRSRPSTTKRIPIRWMPPEFLIHQYFTTKSDVWSYGIVLYEIATGGCRPYKCFTDEKAEEQIKHGLSLEASLPRNTPHFFSELTAQCWQYQGDQRPSFVEISSKLVPYASVQCLHTFRVVSFYCSEEGKRLRECHGLETGDVTELLRNEMGIADLQSSRTVDEPGQTELTGKPFNSTAPGSIHIPSIWLANKFRALFRGNKSCHVLPMKRNTVTSIMSTSTCSTVDQEASACTSFSCHSQVSSSAQKLVKFHASAQAVRCETPLNNEACHQSKVDQNFLPTRVPDDSLGCLMIGLNE